MRSSNKKGFTLIELMFVMVLLALMVIIAYPYVFNAYLKAQKDTFLTEAKTIYRKSAEKYAAELVKNNRLSTITDADKSSLNYGEENLKYCVHLTSEGYVIDIKVTNGTYYVEGKESFLNDGTLESIKYGTFDKFSCDYELDEADVEVEPTLKEIRADEGYLDAIKYICIAFVVTIIIGLIVKGKANR